MNFKACPKCKGDTVLEKDHYGWYHHCIQCGLHVDVPALQTLTAPRLATKVKPEADRLYAAV